MIDRKAVVFARTPQNKEQQDESWDDVTAKVEKRVVQKMAEGHDDQDAAQRDESLARAQAKNDQRSANKLDERNGEADNPERPNRQKSVGERQEIFSGVLDRSQLEHFHCTGHEKDEAENEAGEEDRPGAICIAHQKTSNAQRRTSNVECETKSAPPLRLEMRRSRKGAIL
jgi:hypothetical protein